MSPGQRTEQHPGYAFRTIAETLWKYPEKVEDWKTVLEHGLQDPHPSVRYAVIDALAAVSRVDKPLPAKAIGKFCSKIRAAFYTIHPDGLSCSFTQSIRKSAVPV